LVDLFGLSNQYVGTLERGENCLSVGKIISLCNKTGLSSDYIIFGKAPNNLDDETIENLKQKLEAISNFQLDI